MNPEYTDEEISLYKEYDLYVKKQIEKELKKELGFHAKPYDIVYSISNSFKLEQRIDTVYTVYEYYNYYGMEINEIIKGGVLVFSIVGWKNDKTRKQRNKKLKELGL